MSQIAVEIELESREELLEKIRKIPKVKDASPFNLKVASVISQLTSYTVFCDIVGLKMNCSHCPIHVREEKRKGVFISYCRVAYKRRLLAEARAAKV